MRKTFIEELIEAAKKNKKIILVVNDVGYSVVEKFAKLFPKRFYNAGVAEQNMMGLASGLALEGHHVFVYSYTILHATQSLKSLEYHIHFYELVMLEDLLRFLNQSFACKLRQAFL